MKIVAIGDLHGNDIWKEIISAHRNTDIFVFIGDYFDSLDISPEKQINNFKDLITFKEANKDEVILLLGNHSYHYLGVCDDRYSGYQRAHASVYRDLLTDAIEKNLLQMCYTHRNFLFSHALCNLTCSDLVNNFRFSILLSNLFSLI